MLPSNGVLVVPFTCFHSSDSGGLCFRIGHACIHLECSLYLTPSSHLFTHHTLSLHLLPRLPLMRGMGDY